VAAEATPALPTAAAPGAKAAPLNESEDKARDSRPRRFWFTYTTQIAGIDANAKHLDIWIPAPHNDSDQIIAFLTTKSTPSLKSEVVDLPAYPNRAVHLSAEAPLPPSVGVTMKFAAKRRQDSADVSLAAQVKPKPSGDAYAPFLKADRLAPIDGKIAQLSAKIAGAGPSAFVQARAIYDYVTSAMKYDKSGTGWGRGDAIWACDAKRGNCTDFHSLFIALARARGIPARFTIGFPLGETNRGEISGYHCWAEFYSGGIWVPVDASEAWKNPELREYYFGHIDEDRIAFTTGRDLELKPRQHGAPLNFFIYPYVEVDGVPLDSSNIRNKFEYAEMPSN
jgi:transglutaminase-like putative cysteine protease